MSYAFTGYKWGVPDFGAEGGTVTWSADLSDLQHDPFFSDADFEMQLEIAFQTWEDVAAIDFVEVASGGDVEVGVGRLGNPQWVAVTQWPEVRGPGLEELSTMELIFDIEEDWAPNFGNGTTLQNFYLVATHEIGHVIGLEHVDDRTEIMFASTDGDAFALGDGDVTGAQILYGTDAGDPDLSPLPDPPPESDFDESAGGGGGGGIIALVLGAIAALIAGIFGGGPGGLGALAAAQTRSEEDEATLEAWGEEALDWLPTVPFVEAPETDDIEDALDEDLLDWV